MPGRTTIKVALDWTPNTIHTGLFVALAKNFYSDQGLEVQLLPPDAGYTTTPAKRLENGEVDLAICHLRDSAKDASAIVSTKPEFANIAALENGVYGSYNARYEDDIVKTMVTNAGGDGKKMQIKNSVGKLSLFEEMKQGTVDATWVFMPWEGTEAARDGITLHVFKTENYGVPYGYSPVIARNAATEKALPSEALQKFIDATRQGYEYAIKNVSESAKILEQHCQKSFGFLEQSQQSINDYYSDGSSLGSMEGAKWKGWVDWLESQELIKTKGIDTEALYTNAFNKD
ncbi:hypothetical protein H2203_001407 [Taxawa tesnikishii (nom. ined.)]|nr:hypothetical protein H2203_001407 [Dothideales sp. JES 119]